MLNHAYREKVGRKLKLEGWAMKCNRMNEGGDRIWLVYNKYKINVSI